MCLTASTTFPDPASPFVRIIAAPSATRRRASPKLRAPQTKGTRKSCFQTWCSSSAGVKTSLSSMKSTSNACKTSASRKCPIRTLAITGIVTVFMISRITLIDAIRATPPSLRISEGTRSSAITAQAPAFSAIFACSALVTSMMTPPLSISARPTFTRHSFAGLPFPLPFTFFASIALLLSLITCKLAFRVSLNFVGLADHHKSSASSRQDHAVSISDFSNVKQVSSLLLNFPSLDHDFLLDVDRLQVLDVELRGHRARFAKSADLTHYFVEQCGNNSAVRHTSAALIPLAEYKAANNLALRIVLLKRELHPRFVRAAASKALVRGIWCEPGG